MSLLPGGIDYTPSEVSLRFSPSTKNQTKCAEFAIIQDGLDEGRENFTIKFSKDDQPPGSTEANVTIVACRRGGTCMLLATHISSNSV